MLKKRRRRVVDSEPDGSAASERAEDAQPAISLARTLADDRATAAEAEEHRPAAPALAEAGEAVSQQATSDHQGVIEALPSCAAPSLAAPAQPRGELREEKSESRLLPSTSAIAQRSQPGKVLNAHARWREYFFRPLRESGIQPGSEEEQWVLDHPLFHKIERGYPLPIGAIEILALKAFTPREYGGSADINAF
mmetsp:Transcript_35502/g.65695  ORF Transcript_35502/g.65695 Transcript_35502/m.65695 type:complete len:194 (-) Transcript_35502:2-583(-)